MQNVKLEKSSEYLLAVVAVVCRRNCTLNIHNRTIATQISRADMKVETAIFYTWCSNIESRERHSLTSIDRGSQFRHIHVPCEGSALSAQASSLSTYVASWVTDWFFVSQNC